MVLFSGPVQGSLPDDTPGCAHGRHLLAADTGISTSLSEAGPLTADCGCTSAAPRLCAANLSRKQASYAAIGGAMARYTPFAAHAWGIVAEPCPTDINGDGCVSGQSTCGAVAQLPLLCATTLGAGSDWSLAGGKRYAGSGDGSVGSSFTSLDPQLYTTTSITSALCAPGHSTGVIATVEVQASLVARRLPLPQVATPPLCRGST